MPEFYGSIKRIRHKDITIQQVHLDLYRLWEEKLKKQSKRMEEYFVAWDEWVKTKKGEPPQVPEHDPTLETPTPDWLGPKVTLSCGDACLIDKAIESKGALCKLTVKDGKIETIERVITPK